MSAPTSVAASPAESTVMRLPHGAQWRRRALKIALISVLLVALLLALVAWLVPYVLTSAAPQWLKDKTGRELKVGEASFNPFTLRLNAKNISLTDAAKPLASLAVVDVKGSWATLKNFAWTADNITLTQPDINARIAKDGTLDWVRFLDALPKSTAPPSDTMPRIVLHNVVIENGSVRLTDERANAQEKRLELTPLTFKLDKLSTLPKDRGDYALQATLNDQTRVQWKGRVGLNPIESSGDLAISNLPLTRVQSIANVALPVSLGGIANFSATYSVAAGTDFTAAGIGDGVLEIIDFRASQNKDEASVKSIKVSPLSASWAKTKADGRDQQVLALLPLSAAASGIEVKAGEQADALLSVAQISTVRPINVDLAQRRVDVPQILIAGLQAAIERSPSGAVVLPFVGESSTQVAATQPAKSPAAASPTAVSSWQINLAEITADKAALALRDPSFSTPQAAVAKLDLTLAAAIKTGEKLSVRAMGKRVVLSDFALRDEAAKDAWLAVKEVRAAPFDIDITSVKIELPKIDVMSPVLTMALAKDGLDVAKKLAPIAPVATTQTLKAPTTPTAPSAKLSIAGVALSGGRVSFTDSTLPTALTHVIDAVTVSTDRIELDGARPFAATTNATLKSGGAIQAKLKFDQRGNVGEADIAIERVTLAPLSPYLNRNTRLKIDKGEAAIAGRVIFSGAANAAELLRFEGNTAVRDLALLDETTLAPFAEWAELSSTDIKVVLSAQGTEVTLADLLLDQPRGKLIIAQDGTVNLAQIGKRDAPAAQPPTAMVTQGAPMPSDAEKKTRAKVDRLQVTGGNIEFADLSLRPQFGVRISD